jgi:hypothetical protein
VQESSLLARMQEERGGEAKKQEQDLLISMRLADIRGRIELRNKGLQKAPDELCEVEEEGRRNGTQWFRGEETMPGEEEDEKSDSVEKDRVERLEAARLSIIRGKVVLRGKGLKRARGDVEQVNVGEAVAKDSSKRFSCGKLTGNPQRTQNSQASSQGKPGPSSPSSISSISPPCASSFSSSSSSSLSPSYLIAKEE